MSITQKLQESLIPSLFAAGGSVLVAGALFGMDELKVPVNISSLQLNSGMLIGASSFVGSLGGELITEFVLPMVMKQSAEVIRLEQAYVPPVVDGLATYGAMRTFISQDTSFMNSMITGAGGSLIGKYAYRSFWAEPKQTGPKMLGN
jgi:hypothetical protein